MYKILLAMALGMLLTLNTAQAQVTTVTCTGAGADTPTTNTSVVVDAAAQTCTVIDTGAPPNATAGSMALQFSPISSPDLVLGIVRNGGGALVQQLTDFTTCTIPGGTNIGAACRREANPTGSGTAIIANNLGATLITLTVTYTGNVTGSLDVTSASVTFATPATGPTAEDKSNSVAALQSGFDEATPGLLDSFESFRTLAPGGNDVTFAPTGLNASQSRIDAANPMDREYGPAFAPKGYFDGGQKVRSGNGFRFSVDLTKLASGQDGEENTALGYRGGSKDGPVRHQSRLVSFIKGQYVDFDDGETNADRDGHLWVVTSGIGLRVSPDITVGVLSRYRSGEADSNALNADLDSDFWGGGAFLTSNLGSGLRVSLAGLYEHGNNDIRIGTATGSFDSEHVTIEGRIDKRLERGTFWLEPGVGIRYVETEQDNYTDSTGVFVANQDVTLGRLTYGPKIGTTLYRGDATVKPYAKFGGVWDFENEGNFATSTAGTVTLADHGFNAGGGVEVVYHSGFAMHLSGDWTTYDNDLDVWSISGGIGTPLSALGLGEVGFVSLDLSARQTDASAKARLKIPLGKAE